MQDVKIARRQWPWGRLALLLVYLAVLGVAWMVWRDPAWRLMLSPAVLGEFGREVRSWPFGPVLILLAYVVGVMLGMPVLASIVMGVFIFGAWPGMAYALAGMVAGAVVTYWIGRMTGAHVLDRLLGGRLQLMSTHLHRRGLWTIVLLRFLPVAPFIVVNLGSGALRVRMRDYVVGTTLGLLPGTVMISLFMRQLQQALNTATTRDWIVLVSGLVLALAGLWWVKRHLKRKPQNDESPQALT